ncbi:MAG: endonuclease/exonuclease/phosphatase family protein [Bacteroidales bacterium]|nr:endonuclease/exonuclease/phosphatase family protein [Bacteroidales bacterium]
MKKFLKIFIVFITAITAGSLVISCFSVYIDPRKFLYPAYFGLAFPIIFFLHLVLTIFWILRRNRSLIFFTTLILIISLPWFFDVFQIDFSAKKEKKGNTIKFMTYNVRNFSLYDWKNNGKKRDFMLDFIKIEKADIICYQEFYYERKKDFISLDTICSIQETPFYHIYNSNTISSSNNFGQATFSKYPIVNSGEITFSFSNNSCIFTDVLINTDTIRVYNNHLESIRFMQEEYNLIDSIAIKFEEEEYLGMVKKLSTAYKFRAREVDEISTHIKNCTYPVIVCGDFNDTPISYAYRKMKGDLYDAFKKSGAGIGATYNGNIPFQRIDYILYSRDFDSWNYTTGEIEYSDHYPVICLLELNK